MFASFPGATNLASDSSTSRPIPLHIPQARQNGAYTVSYVVICHDTPSIATFVHCLVCCLGGLRADFWIHSPRRKLRSPRKKTLFRSVLRLLKESLSSVSHTFTPLSTTPSSMSLICRGKKPFPVSLVCVFCYSDID